jgi:hypothetical protein
MPLSTKAPPWLENLRPNVQSHDPDIINYFLNKFMCHVAPMMPTFKDLESTSNEVCGLILAMAAVGGLFCPIEGSFRISLAMHTDAKRLAMSRVSIRLIFYSPLRIINSLYRLFRVRSQELNQPRILRKR